MSKEKIIKLLQDYTKHQYIKLVGRGNAGIFSAMYIAKKVNPRAFMLMPDQGGWRTYHMYPELLNMSVREVKTNYGVIDLDDLKEKAKTGSAFIVSSFAGYYAEQSMKEISKICKENKCLLIEDATGAVGDEKLCNGTYSDIIIASFGRWKPVNVGYSGFISTNDITFFEKAEIPFSLTKVYPDSYPEILKKLQEVKKRMELFFETCDKIKKDLSEFEILHKGRRGINVVVKYKDEKEKKKIIKYCENHHFDHVECPVKMRVLENAISIEVKRL